MSQKPCEHEFDFTLALVGPREISDETIEALFEAGCTDATVITRDGWNYLHFTRSAPSFKEAVYSAITEVRKAGQDVARLDECNLVTQSEIARRSEVTKQYVSLLIAGQRGPGNFPRPACHITEDMPLYSWCEVSWWLYENNMLKEENWIEAREIDFINNLLQLRQLIQQDETLTEDIRRELLGDMEVEYKNRLAKTTS